MTSFGGPLIFTIPHAQIGPDHTALEEVLLRYAREGLTLAQRVAAINADLGYSMGLSCMTEGYETRSNLKLLFFIYSGLQN